MNEIETIKAERDEALAKLAAFRRTFDGHVYVRDDLYEALADRSHRMKTALMALKAKGQALRDSKSVVGPLAYQTSPREMRAWRKARYDAGKEIFEVARDALTEPGRACVAGIEGRQI